MLLVKCVVVKEMDATLCLVMIVKNEERVLERCLDAVRELCDFMIVCDTGSTDRTCDVVLEYFARHQQVQGTLLKHEWVNFGHNRTLSMDAARATGASYALTIDADMVVEGSLDKTKLVLDAYKIIQRNDKLYYANQRIHKLSLPWRSVGVTHEYWTCGQHHATVGNISSLVIDDVGDGGCKSDKFTRDLDLLTTALVTEPHNTRHVFYLAQTHYSLGQWQEAHDCYARRTLGGGWDEEVWYSKYMMGKCHEKLGNWPVAHQAYLDAFDMMPSRSEPLYEVVRRMRQDDDHERAYDVCLRALKVPFPTPSPLFCDIFIYVSGLYFELSIVAFAAGDWFRGLLACEKIAHNCLPWQEYAGNNGLLSEANVQLTLENRLYYVKPLQLVTSWKVDPPTQPGWYWCNPFPVCTTRDGSFLLLRSVNYTLDDTGQYHHPASGAETRNYVVTELCPPHAAWSTPVQVRDTVLKPQVYPSHVRGYEDLRLVRCRNRWYGVATSREMNPEKRAEMVLITFREFHMERVVRLQGHQDHLHQKNWMPFVVSNEDEDDELHFVYMCDPLTILKADLDTGHVTVVHEESSDSWDMSHYRGSSNGLPWGHNGFLFLVHEIAGRSPRTYTHRFVLLERPWSIAKISHPFHFFAPGVEFVTGITMTGDGMLCVGVGCQDREAHIVLVDPRQVNRWLTHGELLFLPL